MANSSGKRARKNSQPNPVEFGFREAKPINYIQSTYLDAIKNNDIIFGIGSAGTGKTYLAASYAAGELFHRRIDKIIITRPNIEVGAGLGYLPGDLMEKFAPFLDPFDAIFSKCLGSGFYEYALKSKTIDPKPLGFMRGATFENCIVLIDECQSITTVEFKMLLTRIGKNCKMIFSGDPDQSDITNSGLLDAVARLEHIDRIEVVRFMDQDIVRSRMCKQIILAYKD